MKKQWKGFVAGIVATILMFGLVNPALAVLEGKTVQIFPGVNIYIDDKELRPVDAAGNPVEVFIYNGTTYLPVRAVSEALGKTVQWDGATSSVYIGKHSGEKPAVMLADLDYFTGWKTMQKAEKDNLGNNYNQAIVYNFNNAYILNGQYSAISGTFFQKYDRRSDSDISYLEIYGDGKLLYQAQMTQGIQPIDFYVDLTGVLKLEVNFYSGSFGGGKSYYDNGCDSAIGNCALWT